MSDSGTVEVSELGLEFTTSLPKNNVPSACSEQEAAAVTDTNSADLIVSYIDSIRSKDQLISKLEAKLKEQEDELASLRKLSEGQKQLLTEASKRESILVVRLTGKESEMQDYVNQITDFKQTSNPGTHQLRSMLLDPAVNLVISALKRQLNETNKKLEQTQNELNAWKFTPDSQTGKRLMAKCRMLLLENEDLGKQISSGKIAKLESDVALEKSLGHELYSNFTDSSQLLDEVDDDNEAMQTTILTLQKQLEKALYELQMQKLAASSAVVATTKRHTAEASNVQQPQENLTASNILPTTDSQNLAQTQLVETSNGPSESKTNIGDSALAVGDVRTGDDKSSGLETSQTAHVVRTTAAMSQLQNYGGGGSTREGSQARRQKENVPMIGSDGDSTDITEEETPLKNNSDLSTSDSATLQQDKNDHLGGGSDGKRRSEDKPSKHDDREQRGRSNERTSTSSREQRGLGDTNSSSSRRSHDMSSSAMVNSSERRGGGELTNDQQQPGQQRRLASEISVNNTSRKKLSHVQATNMLDQTPDTPSPSKDRYNHDRDDSLTSNYARDSRSRAYDSLSPERSPRSSSRARANDRNSMERNHSSYESSEKRSRGQNNDRLLNDKDIHHYSRGTEQRDRGDRERTSGRSGGRTDVTAPSTSVSDRDHSSERRRREKRTAAPPDDDENDAAVTRKKSRNIDYNSTSASSGLGLTTLTVGGRNSSSSAGQSGSARTRNPRDI